MKKSIEWEGSSWKDLCAFPKPARRRAGYELYQIQQGEEPSDWKPMSSVGVGVKEIRIHMENEYRIIYAAKFDAKCIYCMRFRRKRKKR